MAVDDADFAPTPLAELNGVLHALVTHSQAILGSQFVGAYLHGSFALGSWDTHSDVDYLIVTTEEPDGKVLAALQQMHGTLYDLPSPWAQHLEGSYFPADWLRGAHGLGRPLHYLDNGSRALERSTHDNTLVVRWMIRERGVTMAGPPPAALVDPVDPDALRHEVWRKMHAWADELFADPAAMNNRWYQPYTVLGFCRMLHTLETGAVGSKPEGARWAQGALDAAWGELIRAAWADRPDPWARVHQRADPAWFARTFDFVRYALAVGDAWMAGRG
jgi:hypothetical protein